MTAVAGVSGSIGLADPPDADLTSDHRLKVLGVRGRDLERDILLAVHQDKDVPRFVADGPYVEVRQSEAEREVLEALKECSTPEGWATAAEIGALCGKRANTVNQMLGRMKGRLWENYRLVSRQGKGGGYRLEQVS